MPVRLTSEAFEHEGQIPKKYSCRGDDISPPLSWSDAPEGTKSFALIVEDPDAPSGTFTHWLLFNIPASKNTLPEGVSRGKQLSDGSLQGTNSGGKIGYSGPCPPSGTHRYYFRIFAVDTNISLPAGVEKDELVKVIEQHTLDRGVLMGHFSK